MKILCPVDFSEAARAALRRAATMAAECPAKLVLLHVHPRAEARARVERRLLEWRAEACALGATDVDVAARNGVPWSEIVKLAGTIGAGVIVLGAHGRAGMGAVAEKVVRHARCPVLVVSAGVAAADGTALAL
jgi:nucleotide-binding universal stress UspA family protein